MDPILDVIDTALRRKGLSDAAASKLAVGHPALLKNLRMHREGEKRYNLPALQKLAAVLDLEFYFGERREQPAAAPLTIDGAAFTHIPVLDVELSAGPGATNGDELVLDHLAFRQDWLRRRHLTPAQMTLVHVRGDSMKPTLQPGDMVLLDTSDQARELPVRSRPPGKGRAPIYALRVDGEARVKRLLRPDKDTLILVSDNPDWPPEAWSGARLRQLEPAILGKVVWWGHTEDG